MSDTEPFDQPPEPVKHFAIYDLATRVVRSVGMAKQSVMMLQETSTQGVVGCDPDLIPGEFTYSEAGVFEPYVEPVAPEKVKQLLGVDINFERDRRIALGFPFGGKVIDFDEASKQRVTGAATLAGFAIAEGAQPGDLHWHGGAQPFAWITADNTTLEMDAQTMFAMGRAAAAWETAHIFAARALKDEAIIPSNYQDNSFWPPKAS